MNWGELSRGGSEKSGESGVHKHCMFPYFVQQTLLYNTHVFSCQSVYCCCFKRTTGAIYVRRTAVTPFLILSSNINFEGCWIRRNSAGKVYITHGFTPNIAYLADTGVLQIYQLFYSNTP